MPTKYREILDFSLLDFSKGYQNSKRKLGVATHFPEIVSLESRIKCCCQHFSEKEGKDISPKISLEFAFTYRKANTFIICLKDLKLPPVYLRYL